MSNIQRIVTACAVAAALALIVAAPASAAPGWIGVGIGEVTADKVATLKLKEERGVEITSVSANSPAAQAGLKATDVVLEFNGVRVDGVEQFSRLVRETPPGRTVRLAISRDGAPQTISVKLAERKGDFATTREYEFRMPKIEIPEFRVNPDVNFLLKTSRLGIEGQSLSKQLGEYFGAPNGEGVLVASVDKDSSADKAGIKAGDVIIKIDGERVTGMSDLRNALRERMTKASLPIVLIRNKREMTVTAAIEQRDRGDLERKTFVDKLVGKGFFGGNKI